MDVNKLKATSPQKDVSHLRSTVSCFRLIAKNASASQWVYKAFKKEKRNQRYVFYNKYYTGCIVTRKVHMSFFFLFYKHTHTHTTAYLYIDVKTGWHPKNPQETKIKAPLMCSVNISNIELMTGST